MKNFILDSRLLYFLPNRFVRSGGMFKGRIQFDVQKESVSERCVD
jgi:hypothetical protein